MTSARAKAYTHLIIVALIWGAAGPVIKFTLSGIDPLSFLAYRFAISGLFAVIYFLRKGLKLKPRLLPYVFAYGLLTFTIALGALFLGLERSNVLDLTVISTAGPLLIAAGGAIFYKDHITHRERLGIAIVLTGVIISAFIPLLRTGSLRLSGNIFLLIFLFSDASGALLAKKAVKNKIRAFTLTNLGFVIAATTLIPFALYINGTSAVVQNIVNLPLRYHLGVWYMALVSGTLAYLLWVRGQRTIEVSEAALFSYLQPVFAVPLAVLWLGEKITPTFAVGAMLIIAGISIAEYKKRSS